MIGNDIFEDISIDAYELEIEARDRARVLIDEWGPKLTEGDLLRLNAMVHAEGANIEYSIAAYALEYYLTQDYTPEFIHADMATRTLTKKPWWRFW